VSGRARCAAASWPARAALTLALAVAPAHAGAQPPRLGVPTVDSSGVVRWVAWRESPPAWARGLAVPPATRADSLALWQAAAAEPRLRDVAFLRLAALRLAAGDSAGADSCGAIAAAGRAPWAWPALRGRAELALARGAFARADSLLQRADRAGWGDGDRAAWLAARVRARAAAGDTAGALEFARQALGVYPSLGGAVQALAQLEDLLRARGGVLTGADERAAAEVETFAGRSAAAAVRLRRVLADSAAADLRWSAGLRLCEVLRGMRRFREARGVAESVLVRPVAAELRRELRVERARDWLGAGRADSALAGFAELAGDSSARPAVDWEAGRTAEDAGRWEEAIGWYTRAAAVAGRRAGDARFRAGLLWFALGRADSASACWGADEADSADAPRFWFGIARRALGDRAAGDSALRIVAARPGYSFYRTAARDTLGDRGQSAWRVPGVAPARASCPGTRAAGELAAVGAEAEALLLVSRIAATAPDAGDSCGFDPAAEALAGARLAYALGRPGLAVSLADRAARASGAISSAAAWACVPWLFPPAYESLFVAPRDTAVAALEPALLFALTYQESRFDPRARSRSDALGLMQLKLAAAGDMARLAHDPSPTESGLFEPGTNVRYGARYLARLLKRCDGSAAAALEAYNAGAGSLSPRWRELRGRGGEALLCELASNPLAQDYAKRILGYRQAYRELRPTMAR